MNATITSVSPAILAKFVGPMKKASYDLKVLVTDLLKGELSYCITSDGWVMKGGGMSGSAATLESAIARMVANAKLTDDERDEFDALYASAVSDGRRSNGRGALPRAEVPVGDVVTTLSNGDKRTMPAIKIANGLALVAAYGVVGCYNVMHLNSGLAIESNITPRTKAVELFEKFAAGPVAWTTKHSKPDFSAADCAFVRDVIMGKV